MCTFIVNHKYQKKNFVEYDFYRSQYNYCTIENLIVEKYVFK